MTTAVSFPLTEIAVCPEPVMALNAYSAGQATMLANADRVLGETRTDLVETSFRREDRQESTDHYKDAFIAIMHNVRTCHMMSLTWSNSIRETRMRGEK